jgi:hypothetical protein
LPAEVIEMVIEMVAEANKIWYLNRRFSGISGSIINKSVLIDLKIQSDLKMN